MFDLHANRIAILLCNFVSAVASTVQCGHEIAPPICMQISHEIADVEPAS
jgi:hypothetical protein